MLEATVPQGRSAPDVRLAASAASAALPSVSSAGVANHALCSGVAGMCAQGLNVLSLMWMRTVSNVQFRHGGSIGQVTSGLWREGGVRRFYRGLAPALVLAPLSRFGDTAANDAALATLRQSDLPLAVKTLTASVCAASFRIFLLPLDAWETMKQVEGKDGLRRLLEKTRSHPTALWQGASAAVCAAGVGHYTWFYTSNQLFASTQRLEARLGKHGRSALVGCASGAISDLFTNALVVLKTMRQTSLSPMSYSDAARLVIRTEGLGGLFGRGLKVRMMTNSVQGGLFTVSWKAIDGIFRKHFGLTG